MSWLTVEETAQRLRCSRTLLLQLMALSTRMGVEAPWTDVRTQPQHRHAYRFDPIRIDGWYRHINEAKEREWQASTNSTMVGTKSDGIDSMDPKGRASRRTTPRRSSSSETSKTPTPSAETGRPQDPSRKLRQRLRHLLSAMSPNGT
jgi:hypothetical protein